MVSHRTHHRYTMVRGVDPETDFPEEITVRWVWKVLGGMLFTVLTLGIPSFFKAMWNLFQRSRGNTNPMIKTQCTPQELKRIKLECLALLLINILAMITFVVLQRWDLLLLICFAPQVGSAIVAFYHMTEHIGMMWNNSDQRLCSRGVLVSPFVKFLYGGLDEHVEHHLQRREQSFMNTVKGAFVVVQGKA